MAIFIGIIFILGAIIVIITSIVDITENWKDNEITKVLWCCVLILSMCAVIVICTLAIKDEIIHHEYRYPASEYNLETEITTRGEVSDTTYIISKIE